MTGMRRGLLFLGVGVLLLFGAIALRHATKVQAMCFSNCGTIPAFTNPPCPPGTVRYPNGACLPPSSTPPQTTTRPPAFTTSPCPTGQVRLSNGGCANQNTPPTSSPLPTGTQPPCPTGQVRFANGTCGQQSTPLATFTNPICTPPRVAVNGVCVLNPVTTSTPTTTTTQTLAPSTTPIPGLSPSASVSPTPNTSPTSVTGEFSVKDTTGRVELVLAKKTYALGEKVVYSVINRGTSTQSLFLGTCPFSPERNVATIYQGNVLPPNPISSATTPIVALPATCTDIGPPTLQPNTMITASWDQKRQQGSQRGTQVGAGTYTIDVLGAKTVFTISSSTTPTPAPSTTTVTVSPTTLPSTTTPVPGTTTGTFKTQGVYTSKIIEIPAVDRLTTLTVIDTKIPSGTSLEYQVATDRDNFLQFSPVIATLSQADITTNQILNVRALTGAAVKKLKIRVILKGDGTQTPQLKGFAVTSTPVSTTNPSGTVTITPTATLSTTPLTQPTIIQTTTPVTTTAPVTTAPQAQATPIPTQRTPQNVTTDPAAFRAEFVSSNPYPTLKIGGSYVFELKMKNVGTASWLRGTVNLATDVAQDRIPGFLREDRVNNTPSGWISPNRVKMQEELVEPGEIATFRFTYTVPNGKNPGVYAEYFRPVADGITFMWHPHDVYWDVTVTQ